MSAPEFDRQSLEVLYDQSLFAPNAEQVLARMETNSRSTRERIGPPLRLSYGPAPDEGVDVYRDASARAAPIFAFVHGGSWQRGSAARAGFPAETFVRAGAVYAAFDFMSIEKAERRLSTMIDQLRRAMLWLYRNAQAFGADPERIYLAGHSSGAHLAGMLLCTDWSALGGPKSLLKGGFCISGVYDLYPMSLTSRTSFMELDDRVVEEMSPARRADEIGCPTIVAYGSCDSPEFQRQGRAFASAITASGGDSRVIVGEGYNHFEIAETLANPYGVLGRAALRDLMRL